MPGFLKKKSRARGVRIDPQLRRMLKPLIDALAKGEQGLASVEALRQDAGPGVVPLIAELLIQRLGQLDPAAADRAVGVLAALGEGIVATLRYHLGCQKAGVQARVAEVMGRMAASVPPAARVQLFWGLMMQASITTSPEVHRACAHALAALRDADHPEHTAPMAAIDGEEAPSGPRAKVPDGQDGRLW